jgi:hypothetical protein
MKKRVIISFVLMAFSGSTMAYGYYGIDPVDDMANQEIANISAQERLDVMHELREGDFREAQEVMQQDEAMKYQIRQEEAMYDAYRDRGRRYYDYGYDD